MEDIKRIPYGISNFVDVMEQNQYYVDKTMYLPLLEQQRSNLFLIRPRRFGKSLFLSMLLAYYDLWQKSKFEARFGNLWIAPLGPGLPRGASDKRHTAALHRDTIQRMGTG